MIEIQESFPVDELQVAKDEFSPKNFGFKEYGRGWQKEMGLVGDMIVTPITWEHAHLSVNLPDGSEGTVLDMITYAQKNIWEADDSEIVPTDLLGSIEKSGGSLLVSYQKDKGFTPDGWLGISMTLGSQKGVAYLHMIGVNEKYRGVADIGWNMMEVQAHELLEKQQHTLSWTYDPQEGRNAKIYIEKLGGKVKNLTINQFGIPSEQYGYITSDRFHVEMDLLSPSVHKRMKDVSSGVYKGLSLEDIRNSIIATPDNIDALIETEADTFVYQIPPYDKDLPLMERKKSREDLRVVFTRLLTVHSAAIPSSEIVDPALASSVTKDGLFQITGFATGQTPNNGRASFYVMQKK